MPVAITITRSTFGPTDSLSNDQFNAVAIVSAIVPDATGIAAGVITLAGDLAGSAAATPTIANAAITTNKIADKNVTLGKLPDMAQYNLIGKASSGTGSPELVPISADTLAVIQAADKGSARAALGSTTVGDAVFIAASQAAAQSALGATSIGSAVFGAANAAAARAAIGLATVASSGAYSDLSGRPSLATVATSGAYNDLSGRPSLATVATSGDYNDLANLPSLNFDPAGTADGLNVAARTITGGTKVYFEINSGQVALFIDSTFLGFITVH